ncbi:geranylgeranyl diphosphate synthase type II [Natronobacillus azotifigens]|uniref:Farnesyl diphosphate synthase n=1 Tax=Natronobacillus azotifigens TaxID=472978 RepID=A0A9J6RG15_9BACI|nr:farnesyl diphosphate synthase [Natronobacillus azotifigens]MCZ0704097.1 polyprenyl synthetase family protein [Natronobacillus azotifigens]
MDQDLSTYIDDHKNWITEELKNCIHGLEDIPNRLKEAMIYSIQAGGKRIRPILLIASCEAFGGESKNVLSVAMALEMIHTYSLVHDDLPAMDDDDFRRGLPTNHRKFDEATAILVGDGLLTLSFEIIANDMVLSNKQKVYVTKRLAECAGPTGMVAGQALDMYAENKAVTLDELEKIHHLKTGQLLSFALEVGAYLGGASDSELHVMKQCARFTGLAFQIKDDILDVIGDPDKLGKPIGSDEINDKNTYPKLLGLDGAYKQNEKYVQKAKQALIRANIDSTRLADLIDYLSEREQ